MASRAKIIPIDGREALISAIERLRSAALAGELKLFAWIEAHENGETAEGWTGKHHKMQTEDAFQVVGQLQQCQRLILRRIDGGE